MQLDLQAVRESGGRPRVHGNGFIQLDLDDRSRLHIWGDSRIPRQKVPTPIHDHVFGFESTIIVGRLVNLVYSVVYREHGVFKVYTPSIRQGEDTVLGPTGHVVMPWVSYVDDLTAGTRINKYTMQPFTFHESYAPYGPAASVCVKDGLTLAQGAKNKPRVLVPVGMEPDNEFNRYDADPDLLWRIIEDTLGGISGIHSAA